MGKRKASGVPKLNRKGRATEKETGSDDCESPSVGLSAGKCEK